MIFPELPRRTQFETTSNVKTPLHRSIQSSDLPGVEEINQPKTVDVEEWFRQHGLATDPAAGSTYSRHTGPINWFAKDAWELYFILAGMVCWITYWYGVHRGAW